MRTNRRARLAAACFFETRPAERLDEAEIVPLPFFFHSRLMKILFVGVGRTPLLKDRRLGRCGGSVAQGAHGNGPPSGRSAARVITATGLLSTLVSSRDNYPLVSSVRFPRLRKEASVSGECANFFVMMSRNPSIANIPTATKSGEYPD